jgi:putative membrane-bound dehydrogenase-like protein
LKTILLATLLLGAPQAAGPFDPAGEATTFKLPPGFDATIVAAEPDVVDPVAMAFDENGRLYVVEMPGYPNGGVGEGQPREPGRIRLLEKPVNGRYAKATVFATGLNFATSVMPWKKGVLAANAPDLLYLEDTDGDGAADVRRVLYTGFGRKNIQAQLNALQWGLDNWVHALGAGNGGEIRCPEKPDWPGVSLGGRNFRFHPDIPGSLEPETGGGQYGLTADDAGNWFTCQNPQHIRAIVLPDREMARNPHLQPPPATIDIPDHGAAARLYRASAFEPWRVERTRRRAIGPDASRFAKTELVPGGFVTSGSGIVVYRGGLFPEKYRGNTFVCDPANNLIHRDVLVPNGVTFVAKRAEEEQESEFLASTDNWFRPCFLTVGPDGALYLCDFYREVIETPLSLPEDIRAKLNLESRGTGRVWRIAPGGAAPDLSPALGKATAVELVENLSHPNAWRRMNAQRLLVQDGHSEAIPALKKFFKDSKDARARLHALQALAGFGDLSLRMDALDDADSVVREHAVRLMTQGVPLLTTKLLALAEDPAPRVRFAVALAVGDLAQGYEEMVRETLASLARRDAAEPYMRAAILSSVHDSFGGFYAKAEGAPAAFLAELARVVGARLQGVEVADLLDRIAADRSDDTRAAALRGLAQGLKQGRKSNLDFPAARPVLQKLLAAASEPVRQAAGEVAAHVRMMTEEEFRAAVKKAAEVALDESKSLKDRTDAAALLASAEFATAGPALVRLLEPRHPEALQLAAVRALDAHADPGVVALLVENWRRLTPAVRDRAADALFSRKDRLVPLLDAVKKGDVPADHIDARRRAQLLAFPDPAIADKAKTVFEERKPDPKLFDQFRPALDLKGDARRGEASFRKLCLPCHQFGKEGTPIGPNLASVRDNPAEQLLTNILYPSLVVLPNYVQYVVETAGGDILNGVIVESTAASITLRRPNVEDARILRKDIKNLVSSQMSIMPEDLLKGMAPQDVADLIEFVKNFK